MDNAGHKQILLAHGGGGRLSRELVDKLIVPAFANRLLTELGDSAPLCLPSSKICFTTDSFVVKPLFFSGGDIGKLAICGTANDLAVSGATPYAMSLSLIIEEGFDTAILERILASAAATAKDAAVEVVTGDTKVVEKGAADAIFINTAGIGIRPEGPELSLGRIKTGDCIIINGTIGDHGMTVMSQRQGLTLSSTIKSDCACIDRLILGAIESGADIKFMRDPTRGGLAATLNEIAEGCGCDIEINQPDIPVDPSVQAAADVLGFDLLNVANEGKVVMVVSDTDSAKALEALKSHPLGADAAVIGKITGPSDRPVVEMLTTIGGRRIVQMPYGRELPRIC